MTPALGRANQKLYHASILLRLVDRERQREDIPLRHLLDATVPAILDHLRAAYGWFLVELANPAELPLTPPAAVAEVVSACRLKDPLCGELVELRQLEHEGWLHELLVESADAPAGVFAPPGGTPLGGTPPGGTAIQLVQQDWDELRLRECHDRLAELMDRMSHSLEEW